ncbi:MAG: tripartite tricarboxylate transporter permease [Pirellulales bacterium]
MGEAILQAFQNVVLDPTIWLIILGSAVYGVFIGAVPGLTATMAVALLVPVTFWLEPTAALAAIVTLSACAIFAGDIPAVLLRIPGTPASAAYADEAFAMTQQGNSELALGVALVFSIVGGLFGSLVLILLGHQLARAAAWFSAPEYFWMYVIGLSCAVVAARGALLKALVALLLGLLFSTVGLSAVHTEARFTFGFPELYQGINFIPAMIGLFGVSEVLKNLATANRDAPSIAASAGTSPTSRRLLVRLLFAPVWRALGPALAELKLRIRPVIRSSAIGTAIGILPGAGADIAAWVAMAVSKRLSKRSDTAAEQSLSGLADATTANNAAIAGAWIPALVFGIPGDSITAIVIGVLLMKNVKPGPEIFEKQAVLVYSLYILFILSNLVLLPIGLLAIKAGGYIVRVPQRVLLPMILLACVVGAYAVNESFFDIGIMLGMGILGFVLERWQIPIGPIVLGIVLGGPLEERFIQTLTGADGSPLAFFDRPLSAIFGMAAIGLWGSLIFFRGRGVCRPTDLLPQAPPLPSATRKPSNAPPDD